MEIESNRKVKKRSWEEKKALCEQWKTSGKSKREFCRENNIPIASFFPWCDKLWPKPKKHTANLLPVKLIKTPPVVPGNQAIQTEVELNLAEGGPTIRFKLPIKNLGRCCKNIILPIKFQYSILINYAANPNKQRTKLFCLRMSFPTLRT